MEKGVDDRIHQDVWDDSALVNSWNEALAEYKKYHSIHATRGTLDNLPSENEQNDEPETNLGHQAESAYPPIAGQADEAVGGQGKTAHAGTHGAAIAKDHLVNEESDELDRHDAPRRGTGQSQGLAHASVDIMPPPQALLSSVQDEGLKRLLMSWYYAGFYTGLYEGQQKHRDQQRQA